MSQIFDLLYVRVDAKSSYRFRHVMDIALLALYKHGELLSKSEEEIWYCFWYRCIKKKKTYYHDTG